MSENDTAADLLDWLRREMRRESGPHGKANVLRKFLEAVHSAMEAVLSEDPPSSINQWVAKMQGAAQRRGLKRDFHAGTYGILHAIFGDGNVKAHPNKEGTLIDEERCTSMHREIQRLFRVLCADMEGLGLELCGAVRLQLKDALNLHRAQKLINAIAADFEAEPEKLRDQVWPVVRDILVELDPEAIRGLEKNPDPKQRIERAILRTAAKGCRPDNECALVRLATRLPPKEHVGTWIHGDPADRAFFQSAQYAIPVLRIELRAPDDLDPYVNDPAEVKPLAALFGGDHWEVRGPFHFWDHGGNPIAVCEDKALTVSSPSELSNALWTVVNDALRELERRHLGGDSLKAGNLVLLLSVRSDLIHYDWEGLEVLKRPATRFSLAQCMGTVVIEAPDDDYRPQAPDPIAHKDAVVYATAEDAQLHQNQTAPVAVALQAAWATSPQDSKIATPLAIAPSGLMNRSVLVQVMDDTADTALRALKLHEDEVCRSEELINLVGQRKRSSPDTLRKSGAYRIIWLDRRYMPPSART